MLRFDRKQQNSVKRLSFNKKLIKKEKRLREGLPGGPVFKTSPSNAGATGLIPSQGVKIPHASHTNKNIKWKK